MLWVAHSYEASNDRTTTEQWIAQNAEGNSCGLIWVFWLEGQEHHQKHQDSWSPSWDLNLESFEYEAQVVHTWLQYLVCPNTNERETETSVIEKFVSICNEGAMLSSPVLYTYHKAEAVCEISFLQIICCIIQVSFKINLTLKLYSVKYICYNHYSKS